MVEDSGRYAVVVVVRDPTGVDDVLDAAADAPEEAASAAGHPAAHPWRAFAAPLRTRTHSWTARFGLLAVHVLPHWPVLLTVEDTERVTSDPELRALTAAWADAPGRGRVVLS